MTRSGQRIRTIRSLFEPPRFYPECSHLIYSADSYSDLGGAPESLGHHQQATPSGCQFIDREQDRPSEAITVVLGWRARLDSRAAVRDRAVFR